MSNNDKAKKGKEKVLRLDLSRTARAFEDEESLWDGEIDKIEKRLNEHVRALKMGGNKGIDHLPVLSIAIFGSHGSGKTSLLHTFAKRIKDGKTKVKGGNVYSLSVIRPNLVAKDDHFLYAFLAAALSADRDKYKEKDVQYRDSPVLTVLQQRFQELSGYLQVINKDEQSQEDDPLGRSLERLERHESGLLLMEKMRDFINELANLYKGNDNTSIMLMPVDDADMSLEDLVSVLDTHRQFLQHPRLVPVFTFTGRLSEELLSVNFEKKLTIGGSGDSARKLREASTSLLITENMAIQYMARLFPVRNRIIISHASARVLKAKYKRFIEEDEDGEPTFGKEFKVLDLLKTASRLLFGHAPVPTVPDIRPPLRMVSLRRQIQIVDAMQSAGIERFMDNDAGKDPKESWGQTFGMATWSLLNAHRDIMKEIGMNLDDLYSWTPKGLRQVVLSCILNLDKEKRLNLLKHWRYRTEDRRGHIISLLAANVFRPRMAGEEPKGDDPEAVTEHYEKNKEKKANNFTKSISIRKGILWFLNLCIGFYIPQVLAWNRPGRDEVKKENEPGPVPGIGWDLISGPIHAIREAINNNKIFATGMLFLDPGEFFKIINRKENKEPDNNKKLAVLKVFILTWCFYGFKEGKPWAAVSLWRGLGLMGQILKMDIEQGEVDDNSRFRHIKNILWKHFNSAIVLGNLPGDSTNVKGISYKKFRIMDDAAESSGMPGKEMGNAVDDLIRELIKWLDGLKPANNSENPDLTRVYPMDPVRQIRDSSITDILKKYGDESIRKFKNELRWDLCYTRRLHGESFMSVFWQDLDNIYYSKAFNEWKLENILTGWCNVLEDYWKECGADISIIDVNELKKNGYKDYLTFYCKPGNSAVGNSLKGCPIITYHGDKKGISDELKKIGIEKINGNSIFGDPTKRPANGKDE
jgi:hypothetical protein